MKLKSLFTSILLITLLIFALIEFTTLFTLAQDDDAQTVPYVTCKKTELMEVKYAPTGELLDKSVYVRFEIYNNGSSTVSLNVTDRIACINSSTLLTLYGTPTPIDSNFGNLTKITWENVTVDAGKSITYQYTAESLRTTPITVNTTLLVNNKPANITKSRNIYSTWANISNTVTFQITLTNAQQPLYIADNRTAVQPLLCTTSMPLSNDYFSGITFSPRANSTSTLAGKTVMTWITFLGNESQTLETSAKVVDVGPWGKIPIDPIIIQISSSSETLKSYFEGMTNSLNSNIELTENFLNSSSEISTQTFGMYQAIEEIANVTGEFGENTTALVENLCLISQGLKTADSLLEMAQSCIQLASSNLTTFMNDSRTQTFLRSYHDLSVYLNNTMTNVAMAYQFINMTRYGNATVPGLNQLAGMTYEIAQNVNSRGVILGNVTEQLHGLADGLHSMSDITNQTKLELEQPLSELKTEKARLKDIVLTFNSKAIVPFDLEIKRGEANAPCTVNPTIKRLDNTKWRVTNITMFNPANYSRIIYGLSIQLKHGDALIKPFVEVYMDGEWQTPPNMEQLGLSYNSTTETLYIWPWMRIDANSTANMLVDWTGRPLHLLINCETKPTIEYKTDVVDLQKNVETGFTEGQLLCSVIQPQLIVQNFTAPPPPAPTPSPPKSLAELIIEYLQKTEIQLLILIVVAIIAIACGILRKSRKGKVAEKREISKRKIETETLLKEIDEVKRILQKKENPSD